MKRPLQKTQLQTDSKNSCRPEKKVNRVRGGLYALLILILILGSGCLVPDKESSNADTTAASHEISEKSVEYPETIEVQKKPNEEHNTNIVWASGLTEEYILCIQCHGDVKVFHEVAVIDLIDKDKGVRPRLCVVCHGAKIHFIHQSMLDDEKIICDTCHLYNGAFTKPAAANGQLLVCEVCHSNGNYIKIHIEGIILENARMDDRWVTQRSGKQCDTCHIGGYDIIHSAPLGRWEDTIEELIEKAEETRIRPLNISYL